MTLGTTEVIEVIVPHAGVRLIRKGECRRCGLCCRLCPHLAPAGDWVKVGVKPGHYHCLIYDRRGEYCQECRTTHGICIEFPQVPKKHLNPECGFSFYTDDGVEVIKLE
jgi:hypothetical protein